METVVRSDVVLTVGASLVLDFTLKVGRASENVIVNSQVSRVETQNAAISNLVTSEQLHDLPLNGRDFEQLILLAPGVSLVPSLLGQATTQTPTNPIYGNQNNYGTHVCGKKCRRLGQTIRFANQYGMFPQLPDNRKRNGHEDCEPTSCGEDSWTQRVIL